MTMNLIPIVSDPSPQLSMDLHEWRDQYAPDLLGEDDRLVVALEDVRQVAPSTCSVTIFGESGTGKELIARAIHAASPRASAPMVSINCGAISDSLIESELFGHTKGAFTGANHSRVGLFEAANQGTLFLDEVAELSAEAQTKLLRVLQEGEIRPVGSTRTTQVDVRIIAASHVDLEQAVAEGRFREDLFYRLAVFPIALPPLRERSSDLGLLIANFVAKYNAHYAAEIRAIDESLIDELADYPWPGNIRELENLVNRLVVMKKAGTLSRNDLPSKFRIAQAPAKPPTRRRHTADPGLGEPVDLASAVRDFERDLVERALAWSGGNKSKAARLLGVRRTTLVAKIQKLIDNGDTDTLSARPSPLETQRDTSRPGENAPRSVAEDSPVVSPGRRGDLRAPANESEEIGQERWTRVALHRSAG